MNLPSDKNTKNTKHNTYTKSLQREHADSDENTRPLPWFLIMFLGAMAMWGAFYIYDMPAGEESALGDLRTVADLRPPEATAGGASAIDGKQVFGGKCAACHQATGTGIAGVFPPLAGSEWVLGDEKTLANIVLHGVTGSITVKGTAYNGAMPSFKNLSDEELAAVLSAIRSDWGNTATPVTAATVKAQREATQARVTPYNGDKELTTTP
jgi:mono/diheme cytochrome c family protein